MSNTEKALKARRSELVFDGLHYSISKIPLNYRIFIKRELRKDIPNRRIDRDCYSGLEGGIEKAHEVAKECIRDHFIVAH